MYTLLSIHIIYKHIPVRDILISTHKQKEQPFRSVALPLILYVITITHFYKGFVAHKVPYLKVTY